MAGRGTDIILGGNAEFMARAEVDPEAAGQPGAHVDEALFQEAYKKFKPQCDAERQEVLAAGGLHIVGTERHESRRVDNQLRGRAGRQGDPGSSRFFLSLEDDLMRIFGAERIQGLMGRLGMEEDVPIEHSFINRAIENAQKKVEGQHFDSRKNLLEYDDVMNQQRKTIYSLRRQILAGRYAPELSDAEKKAGKVAKTPTESGKHSIDKLSAEIRPVLGRMLESLTKAPSEEGAEGARFDAQLNRWVTTLPLDESKFRSTIYRQFGAALEVTGATDDRANTLDRLAKEVAASLIQQRERVLDLCEDVVHQLLLEHCPASEHPEQWDLKALAGGIKERFGFEASFGSQTLDRDGLADRLWTDLEKIIVARETEFTLPMFMYFARYFLSEEIDARWVDHLKSMEQLREGIGLRGYGQKDPKQEYKKEGFTIFGGMMDLLNRNVCEKLFHMQLERNDEQAIAAQQQQAAQKRAARRTVEISGGNTEAASASEADGGEAQATQRRQEPKVGRNDPCPCGSGKKFKRCFGSPGCGLSQPSA
jgi:preprotein translocase subunit SecA